LLRILIAVSSPVFKPPQSKSKEDGKIVTCYELRGADAMQSVTDTLRLCPLRLRQPVLVRHELLDSLRVLAKYLHSDERLATLLRQHAPGLGPREQVTDAALR